MSNIKITLVQNDISWEDKRSNLLYYDNLLAGLSGQTDLVVLPEMCTTGFSLNAPTLAEGDEGETITAFKQMASRYKLAIAGSFIGKARLQAEEAQKVPVKAFNRGFFIQPDGHTTFSNKRHLFRMGEENKHFLPGSSEKNTVQYMGWNIRLIVCYDLRFPVWTRNVTNEYDLLLVCANWPESRQLVWNTLLTARALENMAYVCGVNRIGTDGTKVHYAGESKLINAYGNVLTTIESGKVQVQTVEIDLESLNRFREKFPVWKDADRFEILD